MNNEKMFDLLITYCEPPYILIKLNCCWILFNAPFVWLALQLVFATSAAQFVWVGIFMLCLLPILFFPTTVALIGMIRRWKTKGKSDRILAHFLLFYKENFKQALQGGIVYSILFFILANLLGAAFLFGQKPILFALLGVLFLIWGWLFNFCCDITEYRISTAKAILKSLFITVTYWYMTFTSIIVSVIGLYLLYTLHLFFVFCFSAVLICFLFWNSYHWSMARGIKKVKRK